MNELTKLTALLQRVGAIKSEVDEARRRPSRRQEMIRQALMPHWASSSPEHAEILAHMKAIMAADDAVRGEQIRAGALAAAAAEIEAIRAALPSAAARAAVSLGETARALLKEAGGAR